LLPNFLILGAEKSATTWLYSTLRQHSDVYLPPTKETHFFNALDSNLQMRDFYTRLGLEWYERFFDDWSGQSAIGEATPMYLCDSQAPGRIRETLPDARLIVCLRNPIDRAYSHYQMAKAKGHTSRTFQQVIEADEERFIGRGEYGQQIERYMNRFPGEQLLVLIFEEMFETPDHHRERIATFLDINGSWGSTEQSEQSEYGAATYKSRALLTATVKAATWMRTHRGFDRALDRMKASGLTSTFKEANRRPGSYPALDAHLRAALGHRYASDVQHLENLLGRALPWKDMSIAQESA
jgi:hypothetical protein